MAVYQKQIGVAIVVVIEEPKSPPAQHLRCGANLSGLVSKDQILLVVIETEKFSIDVGDKKVLPAIPIKISRLHSHSRTWFASIAEGHACRQANLFKFA